MDTRSHNPEESLEALLNWKLGNSDAEFKDEEFLNGIEEHVKEGNIRLSEVLQEISV